MADQPHQSEVVVIGGGVVGVTAALTLADWGVPVVLCEKGRIAGEQSSRNWGWIRKQGRDVRQMPLMFEAQAIWRQLAKRTSIDIGLRQKGIVYLAEDEKQLAEHEDWFERARPYQLDTQMLSAKSADEWLGQDRRQFAGGMLTPSDMHAEPSLAVQALSETAREAGVTILERTAVRTVDQQAGQITGVVTEHGRIACNAVILAGGAWTRPFLENIGRSLPQLAIQSQALRTSPMPAFVPGPTGHKGAAIRPRADGGYSVGRTGAATFHLIPAAFAHFQTFLPTLRERWRILKLRFGPEFFGALGRHRWRPDQMSPFETVRVFDPSPDFSVLAETFKSAQKSYPQLREARILERWGGMIDVMPDEMPVVSPVSRLEGLVVASGLSGHGFGIGPGVGLLAAQLATGRLPVTDPAPFSIDRFN